MDRKGNSFIFNKIEKTFLKQLIDRKFGRITTPKHYDTEGGIEKDILEKTRVPISGSTVERLVGLARDERIVRLHTIEAIAEYLDFESADKLVYYIVNNARHTINREEFASDEFIKSHDLIVLYGTDKEITIRLLEGKKFKILESKNSKLEIGDIVEFSHLLVKDELVCRNVYRQATEVELGQYRSGANNIVRSISMIRNKAFSIFEISIE